MIDTILDEYSPAILLDLAILFDRQKDYNGRRWSKDAILCAQWMELRGIRSAKYIGPFGDHGIKRGDRVRIMKDAIVRDTSPYHGPKAAKKSYTITVHDVSRGCVYNDYDGKLVCETPEVCFVRAGGYWGYVKVSDVELVQ